MKIQIKELKIDEKSKAKLKIAGQIFSYIFLGILLILVIFTVSTVLDIPGGYKLYVVQSGSMEPSVRKGSIVLVQKQDDYQVGDIITFTTANKETVTHRIHEINAENNSFVTKGDANNAVDISEVAISNIIGKVILRLPLIGYPVAFTKTLPGLIILIVIPGVIIIYSELLIIVKELRHISTKKEEVKKEDEITKLKAEISKLKETHKEPVKKKTKKKKSSKTNVKKNL